SMRDPEAGTPPPPGRISPPTRCRTGFASHCCRITGCLWFICKPLSARAWYRKPPRTTVSTSSSPPCLSKAPRRAPPMKSRSASRASARPFHLRPATMPSSTAALALRTASSIRCLRSFNSTSVAAPALITATPPASFARRSCSFSRS
ncbi:MAG: hypothetical protein RI887_573, partial [Actinomycetota bacterium]